MNSIKLVLFTILTILIGSSCTDEKRQSKTAPVRTVKTLTLGSTASLEKHTFPAIVDAFKKADLSFRVSGKIQTFNVKEGDKVKAGDILAILDQSDIKLKLTSAKADYIRAKAEYERAEQLVEKGHVSRTDFDRLEASFRIAESNWQATQREFDYTTLVAPFSGAIAKRHVENYEEINAKAPILTLHDVTLLTIKIDLPESIMIRSTKENVPPKIYAEFEDVPGETFPLTIREVATQADEKTGTYQVSMIMENPMEYNILPGMSATVTGQRDVEASPDNVESQTFLVPAIAVLEDSQGRYVYLAQQEAEKSDLAVASKRYIQTGNIFQSGIEIISGLQSGDKVIVAGVSKMREGLAIKISGGASL